MYKVLCLKIICFYFYFSFKYWIEFNSVHRIFWKIIEFDRESNMLNTTKKVMEWLCVLPADKASTKQQRISHCMVVLFGLTIKISCVFAHLIFFVKNIHTELNQSLFALLGLIGVAGAVYVEISGVILRNKMATIFEQLSDIHDAGK